MGDFGRYGLAIVGGVAGAFIGNPYLGFALGSALGTALFPEQLPDQRVEGPRLGDLRVQASTYGRAIPIVDGQAVRIAGNIIWSSGVEEARNVTTQDVGGKGGPSQEVTQTTYSYSESFAVLLCEGEIAGIRKIWANGELIYNIGSSADYETYIVSQGIAAGVRVYLGTETQEPDPLISAVDPDTPAYRGSAYAVFEASTRLTNQTNFEFEVVRAGSNPGAVSYLDTDQQFGTLGVAASITQDGNLLAWWKTGAGPRRVAVLNPYTGAIVREYRPYDLVASLYTDLVPPAMNARGDIMFVEDQAEIWVWPAGGAPVQFTAGTGTLPARFQVDELGDFIFAGLDASLPAGLRTRIWRMPAGQTTPETITVLPGTPRDLALDWDGNAYISYASAGTGHIMKFRLADGAQLGDAASATYNRVKSLAVAGDGSVWFTLGVTGGDFEVWRLPADFSAAAKIYDFNGTYTGQDNTQIARDWSTGDIVFAVGPNYYRHAADGTAISTSTSVRTFGVATDPRYPSSIYLYNHIAASGGDERFLAVERKQSLTISNVPLSTVLTNLCARAGLTAGDIDVTALTATYVRGYVLAERTSAAQAIAPLLSAFQVDAIETAGKIKFIRRGSASVATIPEADMGARLNAAPGVGENAPDPLNEDRIDEPSLPREIALTYLDIDADYQPVTQYARRLVVRSDSAQTMVVPVVMSAAEAAAAAETLLYEPWLARRVYEVPVSRKYARLEVGDAVDLVLAEDTVTARIVKKDEGQGLVRLQAVGYDAGIYTQSLPGVSAPDGQPGLSAPTPAQLTLLDTALLREQDDDYGFYAAAGGVGAVTWDGGKLFKSTDNVEFSDTGIAWLSASGVGYSTTQLADFSGGNVFDNANTVTVVCYGAALSSTTEASVLNGANSAWLGGEIIQYTTATQVSANTWTLSGLLRGRLGTEWAMRRHAIGERFAVLTIASIATSGVRRVDTPSTDANAVRWYKGVTFGTQVAVASPQSFTLRANGLKPLSPVHCTGSRDGSNNVTATFVRRARKNAGWSDYIDVPLDEPTESYETDFFAGGTKTITGISRAPDGVISSTAHGYIVGNVIYITGVAGMTAMNDREFTIATVPSSNSYTVGEDTSGYPAWSSGGTSRLRGRTVASSSASAAYSAANQTTDYGSPQNPIYFVSHQLSSRVGRGYGGQGVI